MHYKEPALLFLLLCLQELQQVQQQLVDMSAQLQTAHADLARDEEIFAERVREMAKLRDELALLAAAAERERQESGQQMQQLRADLRR
jgi:citrate synthase